MEAGVTGIIALRFASIPLKHAAVLTHLARIMENHVMEWDGVTTAPNSLDFVASYLALLPRIPLMMSVKKVQLQSLPPRTPLHSLFPERP